MKKALSFLCFLVVVIAALWQLLGLWFGIDFCQSGECVSLGAMQAKVGSLLEITADGVNLQRGQFSMEMPYVSTVNAAIRWAAVALCLLAGISLRK